MRPYWPALELCASSGFADGVGSGWFAAATGCAAAARLSGEMPVRRSSISTFASIAATSAFNLDSASWICWLASVQLSRIRVQSRFSTPPSSFSPHVFTPSTSCPWRATLTSTPSPNANSIKISVVITTS
ncbi:putative lipoprotein [Acidobacterium capsulatum ATCC 51196]|uniref:Putative lipoprotein n=1 Tax=Acidobacterium capsulatum (strain ATCC 51196 / DSM 11244 / BCRC 80197 / JCM 7670 / NBRC 15755 / NCIMB 13165 / 161) TaxID=240015 RepID=C1FA16_ACIC5|nr:putative lipoprotein [Acidobacterium capsulatum ATCC 51196]